MPVGLSVSQSLHSSSASLPKIGKRERERQGRTEKRGGRAQEEGEAKRHNLLFLFCVGKGRDL